MTTAQRWRVRVKDKYGQRRWYYVDATDPDDAIYQVMLRGEYCPETDLIVRINVLRPAGQSD